MKPTIPLPRSTLLRSFQSSTAFLRQLRLPMLEQPFLFLLLGRRFVYLRTLHCWAQIHSSRAGRVAGSDDERSDHTSTCTPRMRCRCRCLCRCRCRCRCMPSRYKQLLACGELTCSHVAWIPACLACLAALPVLRVPACQVRTSCGRVRSGG
jgi:hypothetical protein